MTVISTLSIFWLGISCLALPGAESGALWKVMPSDSVASLLRSRMLLRQFDVFTGLLEPAGLRIARLMLDGKHAWRMRLDNGSEVLLGRRDIERRAARMARLFTHDWAMERDRVERLDMRYTNGVAVAWKGEPAAGRKYRARAGGAGATQQ